MDMIQHMSPQDRSSRHLTLLHSVDTTVPTVALLRRAQRLREFADRIDRSLVLSLRDYGRDTWRGQRAELGIRMLDRNIVQLRRAANELRRHADQLEDGPPHPAA